jgi:hypothetical protein
VVASAATYACVLQTISGRFQSSNNFVYLEVDASYNWVLSGSQSAASDRVSAFVACAPWTYFHGDVPAHNISDEFVANGTINSTVYVPMWGAYYPALDQGDSFCFMAGAHGTFTGWLTDIAILRPSTSNKVNTLAVSAYNTWIRGTSRCISFSAPGHTVWPRMWPGKSGIEYDVSGGPNSTPVQLPPPSQALCALTQMAGNWASPGDYVQILQGGNLDYQTLVSGGTDTSLVGTADCIYYAIP